jgi:hypothetical protein
MTNENDVLRDNLRAWMKSPAIGLSKYSADPIVQRRVGGILANYGAKFASQSRTKLMTAPVRAGVPPKS